MVDKDVALCVDDVLALREQRDIYLSLAKKLRDAIASLDDFARDRLLAEYDEAMGTIYMLNDDYREQMSLFKMTFARLYKEFHFTYLSLMAKMDDEKENE